MCLFFLCFHWSWLYFFRFYAWIICFLRSTTGQHSVKISLYSIMFVGLIVSWLIPEPRYIIFKDLHTLFLLGLSVEICGFFYLYDPNTHTMKYIPQGAYIALLAPMGLSCFCSILITISDYALPFHKWINRVLHPCSRNYNQAYQTID